MRYLQYGTLQKLGLGHFDSWAASFGETQTAIDVACQLGVHQTKYGAGTHYRPIIDSSNMERLRQSFKSFFMRPQPHKRGRKCKGVGLFQKVI